jgi:hypothetical protein
MIIYLVLNVPWMYLSTVHSTNDRALKWRKITFGGFVASILPLIYLFIQHSVNHVPGGECGAPSLARASALPPPMLTFPAYTRYAFFEWSLVGWDVAFDAATLFELGHLQVRIIDTTSTANGAGERMGGSPLRGPLPPRGIRHRRACIDINVSCHIYRFAQGLYIAPVPRSASRSEEDWTAAPSPPRACHTAMHLRG